jgi:hypothetical protein
MDCAHTTPELFDALDGAVRPMHTLAEKRSALTNFLSAGLDTSRTVAGAFDHQTDRLIVITTELTPVVGVLADNGAQFHPIFTRMQRVADKFYTEAWNPETNVFTMKGNRQLYSDAHLHPRRLPAVRRTHRPKLSNRTRGAHHPSVASRARFARIPATAGSAGESPQFRPRRAVRSLKHPNHPLPNARHRTHRLTGVAAVTGRVPAAPPADTGAPAGVQPQTAVIGGNVGPVGSDQEKHQLSLITGGTANTATELLLGPLARGATVHVAPDTEVNGSYRKSLIGLSLFLVAAIVTTSMVFVTLRRDVSGPTNTYTAMFTDVSGLAPWRRRPRRRCARWTGGQYRPGRHPGQSDVPDSQGPSPLSQHTCRGDLPKHHRARYLGLSPGTDGDTTPLADRAQIPLDRTKPSFDIAYLLNGFEPLFSVLDPKQVDNLTTGIVQALQGIPAPYSH